MIRFYAHWFLAFMCLGLGFAVSRGAQVQQAPGEQARDPYQEDRDAPRAANPVAFRQDVEQAIAEAKAAKTPYLLDFEASWCGPCRQMDELVYTAQPVVDAAKGIVCIKVDGDQRRDLMELHQIRGYPTGILFGPEGKEITRFLGYRNVRQMVAFLQGGRRTPDDMPAFIARVDALGREKSWSVLENEVAAWITDHPSQANDLRLTIAAGLGGMADPQAKGLAEKLLREVLATDSKSARALNTLAIIVGTSSRFDEAIQLNRELLTVDPDNARAMNDLAWVLSEEKGQYDEAMALAEKAAARNPENPHILDTYGVVCFHLGRIQEAEKSLKDALRLMPPSSRGAVETRYHLAEVYETKGLNAEAADLFQRSLNLHNGLGGLTSRQASHATEFLRQHPGCLLAGNSGAILSGTKDRPDQSSSEIPPVEADKLLRGTWGWDIDRGNDQDRGAVDLWWEQVSQSERYLVPQNGAQLAVIRDEPFAAVTLDDLRKAKFTSGRISASDAEPTIDVGTILGVRTTEGNLVKMEVLGFDPLQRGQLHPKYDMRLRYVIYRTGASQSMDQAVAKQQRPRVTSDANQPVDIGASIPVNDRKLHESFQGGLTRLIENGKDTKIGVLLGQLQRSHCSLALPDIPARKMTLAELYQSCRRSVLVVGHLYNCKQCGRQHVNMTGGFVLTASGAIVTNYHVANWPDSLVMGAMTADGKVYAVKEVLAADRESDVAILQLDGSGFTPLALSSEVSIGASAAVIDHPAGNFYTLTPGVISNHFTLDQNGPSTTWIAATADIGPGSSGAPLLNESGAVIGIASRRLAIPDSRAENHQPPPPPRAVNLFAPADAILRLVSPTPTVASKGSTGPALDRAERIQRQQTPVVTNQPSKGGRLGDLAFLVGGRRISGITSSGQVVPFPVASGIVRLHGDEVYVAVGGNSRDSMVTVCNRAGAQLRTIPVPAEVRYFIDYVVLPDERIAFLDNRDDAIYFIDRTGKYLKTARMRETPDRSLQNCDGVVVGKQLIISEDGDKHLLAVDLTTHEVTIFRDLTRLPGPGLGPITFAEGKFYISTLDQVFSFAPDDPAESYIATVPGNITGIAYQAGRLFVAANHAGVLSEIDLASRTTKVITDNLQYPEGVVVLPRTADTTNQPAGSTVRASDQQSVSLVAFLDRSSPPKPGSVIPQENLQIPADLQACAENLKKIDIAIAKYCKDHGQPPNWLSDLVPNYLSQETLLCPKDSAHSSLSAPDPKLPCSYSWQLSSASSPFMENPIPYRTFKEQQVSIYGGVIPMVRCMHHGSNRILNLSLDGKIYWAALTWESLFRPNPSSAAEQRGSAPLQVGSGRPPDQVARPSSTTLAVTSGKPDSTIPAPESHRQPAANSVEPRTPVRVSFEENKQRSVGYMRPSGIELSATEPPQNWLLPPVDSATHKRFWSQRSFGSTTVMNLVVQTPHAPETGPWDVFVTFDKDVDFRSKAPVTIAARSGKKIEFDVAYGGAAKQPYAICIYPNTLNPGRYSLTYYRAYVRTGTAEVLGRRYRIALSDDNGDGLYSDLTNTMVLIDHEGDGQRIQGGRFMADSPIRIGQSDYFTIEISDDGSSALLRPAAYGVLGGAVTQTSLNTAIPRARVKVMPYEFEAITDPNGRYQVRLPVGRYYEAQVTAQGYIPEHVDRVPLISPMAKANLDVRLNLDKGPHSGEMTLYDGDSYHFLSGRRYKFTGGDFYFRCHEHEPTFFANNRHQGGLVDLGPIQTPLEAVTPPVGQYNQFGVPAEVGHVYASPARQGEDGCHIIFKVTEIKQGESCTLSYYYRQSLFQSGSPSGAEGERTNRAIAQTSAQQSSSKPAEAPTSPSTTPSDDSEGRAINSDKGNSYLEPGYPAPAFSGKDLKGNSIELSKEAGSAKYVLLDFWASWCGPCREEFPYLRRLHAGYKDRGLRILGVNLDSNRDAAQRVAQENGLDYPHVFDGLGWKNAVAVQYRVHAIPQTYLLDSNLNIVAKNLRGPGLEQKIAALLSPANDEAIKMLKTKPVETHPPRAEAVSAQPYVNLNFDNDMLEQSPASPSPGPGTCEYFGTGQCSVKPSLGNYSNKLLVLEDVEAGKKNSNFTVLPNNELTGILSIEFDIVISDEVFKPNPEGYVMTIFSCGPSDGSGWPAIFDISLTKDGYINPSFRTIKPCLFNEKQHFQIIVDTEKQVYRTSVDGETLSSNRRFNNLNARSFCFLKFSSMWESKTKFGIDNIVVSNYEGTAAPAKQE